MLYTPLRTKRIALLGWLLVGFAATSVRAQTGPELLLKPWPTDQTVESTSDGYFLNAAHSDTGSSLQLSEYESQGRFRIVPGNLVSPRIGYDFTLLQTNSKSGVIPKDLTDESVAIGTAIGEYHGWVAGLTLGIGYAGDTAFERGSAWYGNATLGVGKQINDNDILGIVLDYDGNRPYFPDIPLPGVVYRHKVDPEILLALGLPYSSIEWRPTERLKLEASYTLVSQFAARVGYEVVKHVFLYGSYADVQDAFHVADLGSNRRLLFSQQRVESGVEFSANDHLMLRLAAGYAFDNRFQRGFDFDNPDKLVNFSDSPYAHAALELRF
jgi:hypothetical protein